MDLIEVLYDHYKETFSLCKEAQSRRNKCFIGLCILEAVSFFIIVRPEKAFELLNKGFNEEFNTTLALGNTILQTLIWLLIAYVMIRYVQDMMYIEQQYAYLETLEKEIAGSMSINIFAREGENYRRDYPIVLNLIDLFYKMLMPIFFMIINMVRIYEEWIFLNGKIRMPFICDAILAAAIFVITWFYFFEIHDKITDFCKRYIPFVDKVSSLLRKLLREV